MDAQRRQRRTILTEDGELHDVDDSEMQPAPEYCTRCGTANPPESRFCRKCGHSLEEQAADVLGMTSRSSRKSKHDRLAVEDEDALPARRRAVAEETPSHASAAAAQILSMLMVVVMGITALVHAGGIHAGALIPIAIGWISVEAMRSSTKALTDSQAAVRAMTSLLVMVLVLAAIIGNATGAVIPIMIGWVSIEGIRSGS